MFAGGTFEGIVRYMNMKQTLLFGLGNPGEKFNDTRHNLGADVVLAWIDMMRASGAKVSEWKTEDALHVRVCNVLFEEKNSTVIASLLFMNDSGLALAEYMRYYKIEEKDVLIVHDDLELALGEIKVQTGGSAKGHNGIRSIQEHLADANIARLRIGIGRPADETPVEKFVLSKFLAEEKAVLDGKKKDILEAITNFLSLG